MVESLYQTSISTTTPFPAMSTYPVHLLTTLGLPRNHHAILIELTPSNTYHIFQVSGNIQEGMAFNHKQITEAPEHASDFVDKKQIGTILVADLKKVQSIVEDDEPPPKQFDGPRRIRPDVPLRRCQEWTAEAVGRLRERGVLRD